MRPLHFKAILVSLLFSAFILWTIVIIILGIGFGGPIVLLFCLLYFLWYFFLARAITRLLRLRWSTKTYILSALLLLNALILLSSLLGRTTRIPEVTLLLLLLFFLPFALWGWIGVRKLRGKDQLP